MENCQAEVSDGGKFRTSATRLLGMTERDGRTCIFVWPNITRWKRWYFTRLLYQHFNNISSIFFFQTCKTKQYPLWHHKGLHVEANRIEMHFLIRIKKTLVKSNVHHMGLLSLNPLVKGIAPLRYVSRHTFQRESRQILLYECSCSYLKLYNQVFRDCLIRLSSLFFFFF